MIIKPTVTDLLKIVNNRFEFVTIAANEIAEGKVRAC